MWRTLANAIEDRKQIVQVTSSDRPRPLRCLQGGASGPLEHGPGLVPEDPGAALPASGQGDERDAGLRVGAAGSAVHRASVGRPQSRLQGLLTHHASHLRPLCRHRPRRGALQIRRGDEVQQEAVRHLARTRTGKSW